MDKFDYGKAEGDLYDVGCPDPEEIYDRRSEKGFNDFMRENGLNPDKYRKSDHQGNGNSGHSDSGCFLTSACVMAEHLPDDCHELTVLRNFRDTYLSKRANGIHDIAEYYRCAPLIVEGINRKDNAPQIWHDIYTEMVVPCVNFIEAHREEEAYSLYRNTTMKLKAAYTSI